LRINGDALRIGAVGDGVGCTINITSTDWVFCSVATEIIALYEPGFIPTALIPTVGDEVVAALSCPLEGVIVSQFADELACHSMALEPQLDVAVKFNT
jgi:hypothetical protein